MTQPTFALCRETDYYHGRSYTDYLRLIELSGYDTCYFDEVDAGDPARCYIVSPYDPSWGGWPDAKARIIWWDLEWRLDTPFPTVPGVSEVWISDKAHADRTGKQYVPLGSHPCLKLDIGETGGKVYDVTMMAYMTDRRQRIVAGYTDDSGVYHSGLHDLSITISPQGWYEARHAALCQSTAFLHVHQHDNIRTVAPQRWALAAAYSLPLISETIDDRGILGYSDFLVSDYANLPQFVSMWTKRNDSRIIEDYGRALHQKLCVEYTFRKCVEAAL